MARNDDIINKPDPNDESEYNQLLSSAIRAKIQIEKGFIDLAKSIFSIHKKKLYKLKYKTFEEFCNEELGFSRQTIYIYIGILKLITSYSQYFSEDKAVQFGHKKMRHITEGVSAIDKNIENTEEKEKLKIQVFQKVKPEMSATEIEAFIDDLISEIS